VSARGFHGLNSLRFAEREQRISLSCVNRLSLPSNSKKRKEKKNDVKMLD
jgi:hypothetical protein